MTTASPSDRTRARVQPDTGSASTHAMARRDERRLAIFDYLCGKVATQMGSAYRSQEGWTEAVRAALSELLSFLDARPNFAHFMIVRSLAGDSAVRARRGEVLATLARELESDCPSAVAASSEAPAGGEALMGGEALVTAVASVLHACLRESPPRQLRGLCNPLMAMIVLPYLGPAAARHELVRG